MGARLRKSSSDNASNLRGSRAYFGGGNSIADRYGASHTPAIAAAHSFPYDLRTPATTMNLPGSLEEISGLGLSCDGTALFAVNDEHSILFRFDTASLLQGEITLTQESFHDKGGDYEGVEAIGDTLYVMDSAGTIRQLADDNTSTKFNGRLNRDYDCEAFGYDPQDRLLLVGTKTAPDSKKWHDTERRIYAIDPASLTEDGEPSIKRQYTISVADVRTYVQQRSSDADLKMRHVIEDGELRIRPSGLAVYQDEVYVLSSKGRTLTVLDRVTGDIQHIAKLPRDLHEQPEGIAIDPRDGRLFISNEQGGVASANIHSYVRNA